MVIKSTVRYCPLEDDGETLSACPYQNAYWNGEQIVFGAGSPAATTSWRTS
jgi:hypothetical protein